MLITPTLFRISNAFQDILGRPVRPKATIIELIEIAKEQRIQTQIATHKANNKTVTQAILALYRRRRYCRGIENQLKSISRAGKPIEDNRQTLKYALHGCK